VSGLPDEAVVIRFTPCSAQGMLRAAARCHAKYGRNGVSFYADVPRHPESFPGLPSYQETVDDLLLRILTAAEMHGINPETNQKFWYCSSAGLIRSAGFEFSKLGYEGEIAEHWSIDLGKTPTEEDTERISALFTKLNWKDL